MLDPVGEGLKSVIDVAAAMSRSRKLVKEEIDGGDPAVPGDDKISSGDSRRLARAAFHPTDPPSIAHHLRRGEQLISEVRMRSLDHARDAVDLVAATVNAAVRVVEYSVFVKDLVDRRTPTQRIDLTEHLDMAFLRFGVETRSFCCWKAAPPNTVAEAVSLK